MYEDLNSGIYHIWIDRRSYFYLGSTNNFDVRKENHLWKLENNKHDNTHLQNAYNKHKKFHFEIVYKLPVHYLETKEQYLLDITECWRPEIGYNISIHVHAPMRDRKHTEKSREQMSISAKNRPPITDESRARMCIANTRPCKEETKKKIGDGNRGKKHGPLSPEHKRKIGDKHIGRWKGEKSLRAKLTPEQVIEIKKLRKENPKLYTQQKLGDMFGVARTTIQKIDENRSWTE